MSKIINLSRGLNGISTDYEAKIFSPGVRPGYVALVADLSEDTRIGMTLTTQESLALANLLRDQAELAGPLLKGL